MQRKSMDRGDCLGDPAPSRLSELHRKQAEKVFVDCGSRGYGMPDSQVFISSGVNPWLKHLLKRRQAIESVVRYIKNNGLLGHDYLKGTNGDQMNAMLSYARHSMRITLKKIRIFAPISSGDCFLIGPETPMSFLDFRRCCPSA